MKLSFNIKLLSLILPVLLLVSSSALAEESKKAKATPKKTSDYAWYLKAGDRNPKWNELIEPGFTSFDSGSTATASVFLRKAYDLGCRDGLLLFRLAIIGESQKSYKEAAELMELAAQKIPKQYPSHPLARGIHEHAARALYQADDFARALPHLKTAIEAAPDSFMLLFMAGQILRLDKKLDEAKAMFERALAVAPPEGLGIDPRQRIWRELMMIAYDMKDYESSAAYADLILAASPADPVALSYKQQIERARFQQKEREIIKKLVQ